MTSEEQIAHQAECGRQLCPGGAEAYEKRRAEIRQMAAALTVNADPERLKEAAEVGRRAAEELAALAARQQAALDQQMVTINNYSAAMRISQATGGTMQDACRMVYEAGSEPLEAPRPRLVVL